MAKSGDARHVGRTHDALVSDWRRVRQPANSDCPVRAIVCNSWMVPGMSAIDEVVVVRGHEAVDQCLTFMAEELEQALHVLIQGRSWMSTYQHTVGGGGQLIGRAGCSRRSTERAMAASEKRRIDRRTLIR